METRKNVKIFKANKTKTKKEKNFAKQAKERKARKKVVNTSARKSCLRARTHTHTPPAAGVVFFAAFFIVVGIHDCLVSGKTTAGGMQCMCTMQNEMQTQNRFTLPKYIYLYIYIYTNEYKTLKGILKTNLEISQNVYNLAKKQKSFK